MISVNTNYTNLRNNGANIEWRVTNGSNTFGISNIISGSLTTSVMEQLSIGNCIAAELDLSLWGVTVDTSSPLVLQFRAEGDTTWYTKGTFFVDTLEKDPYSEETSITAFDAMLKTEVGYMATNVWVNTTDVEVVSNIASDLGVALDGDTFLELDSDPIALTHAPNIGENGTTDRQMLSYIAAMRGGNWIINSANALQLIYPSTTPANTAEVDKAVVNFAVSETITVSKVKVNYDSETFYIAPSNISEEEWKALAGYCIEVDLPFYGTQAVADALFTQYNGKTFIPFTAEGAYVDPKYGVGDGVRFQKDTTYYTSVIANQTIEINWLCPSDLYLRDEEKLQSLYPYLSPRERQTLYQFGELQTAVEDAESAASAAQTAAEGANYREQIIYISKPSGTNSVAANTTWVTNATGNQNVWTTTRPVYSSSYPVLFVATQRQSVAQSSGTTCTCTTPVKDQTTTVIDGGHITTGTIDASVVNVTNINADNIETGTLTGVTISGNTISGNTITGGTISGTTITGSTLTSTSSSGSVKIADGSIDFYTDANTAGTPYSRMKHVYNSSLGQHAIEWTNSGYTKIINQAGGQWTGNFVQFALDANNPQMQLQIYPDSDGTHTKLLSQWIDINGNFVPRRIASTSDYFRFVIALCKSYNGANDSWWSGRIIYDRQNGVIAPHFADVVAHNRYASGNGWVSLKANSRNTGTSKTDGAQGWRPCTFIYGGETYAGIEGYFTQSAPIYIFGCGSFAPFAIHYYNVNTATTLNSEVYNSLNFSGTTEFSSAVPIIEGGTGATTAQAARANLGMVTGGASPAIGSTEVLCVGDVSGWSSFIMVGYPSSNYQTTAIIPKSALSTTVSRWQLSDETHYIGVELRLVGNALYGKVAATNNGTKTVNLYGLAGA